MERMVCVCVCVCQFQSLFAIEEGRFYRLDLNWLVIVFVECVE